MSCSPCSGGQNQILSLDVPVTDRSDGAPSDVSGLIADKTIEISGTYVGQYIVLGSHNGVTYTPLLTFDSGSGAQSVRQSMNVVTRFVKIRRRAQNLSGHVTASIGSPAACDANKFVALAAIPTNSGVGPRPVLDLWNLIPSNGLRPGITAFCNGDFEGFIAVEGSLDGLSFAPVGENSSGEDVGGFSLGHRDETDSSGGEYELPYLSIPNLVRFIRLRVAPGTFVRGSISVTIGGVENLACPANSGNGIFEFDSINYVGSKLVDHVTTGLAKGTLAYVGNDNFDGKHSVQDFFVLKYGEALTPDGFTIVNSPTFATDGAQWVRQLTHNPANAARGFWCIDPSDETGIANDENSGWGTTQAAARLNPLRTIEELNRRMVSVVISGTVIFEQYSSFAGPQNGQLTNIRTENGNGYPIWMGRKTSIFTGVISAYSPENPTADTRTMMTVTGLGASHVGKLIMNAAGTKSAMIQKDMGGGQVGITLPTASTVEPYVIGQAAFAVDETVHVYSLPSLFNFPFPQSCLYSALTWTTWNSGYSSDQMAGSHPSIFGVLCINLTCTGNSGIFDGCLFSGRGFLTAPGNATLQNCGIRNGTLDIINGLIGIGHQTIDIQNGTLLLTGSSTLAGGTVTTGIGAFDCTGTSPGSGLGALVIQRGAGSGKILLSPSGVIYGSGNTGYLIVVAVGTQSTVPRAANCTATTSAAKPLLVEGVAYDYANMPVATANLTGLNNTDA